MNGIETINDLLTSIPAHPQYRAKEAWILLRLLEVVPDTDQLQILLEPANLLQLLLFYGYQPSILRYHFAAGKRPSEFLLELLQKEPLPERMIALLNTLHPETANLS